jgi:hypothetical protein
MCQRIVGLPIGGTSFDMRRPPVALFVHAVFSAAKLIFAIIDQSENREFCKLWETPA